MSFRKPKGRIPEKYRRKKREEKREEEQKDTSISDKPPSEFDTWFQKFHEDGIERRQRWTEIAENQSSVPKAPLPDLSWTELRDKNGNKSTGPATADDMRQIAANCRRMREILKGRRLYREKYRIRNMSNSDYLWLQQATALKEQIDAEEEVKGKLTRHDSPVNNNESGPSTSASPSSSASSSSSATSLTAKTYDPSTFFASSIAIPEDTTDEWVGLFTIKPSDPFKNLSK